MLGIISFYFHILLSISLVSSTTPSLLFGDDGLFLNQGDHRHVHKDKKILISAIVVSSLAAASLLGFLITQLFFMCFGKSKKVKKKSQSEKEVPDGGESSGGVQARSQDGDRHVSGITTGTVNARDDHKDSGGIHAGNIDSSCLDGGALKTSEIETEVNHSADKVSVEIGKKTGCEQDEMDSMGCKSCEIEEDVNRCTEFVGNDNNKTDNGEKTTKSGSNVSGKNTGCQLIMGAVTDILEEQNNGTASANIVEGVGERYEVPGLSDDKTRREKEWKSSDEREDNGDKINVCHTEGEPWVFSPQEIGESESVAVNCVGGSDQSQTSTKLKNSGGDDQSCCVVSDDSFNDNGAKNINNFVQQVNNGNSGHVRESSGIEEDDTNGINAKHSASSIDMTKEIKEVESNCESSEDDSDSINQNNVSSSTSNSDGIEGGGERYEVVPGLDDDKTRREKEWKSSDEREDNGDKINVCHMEEEPLAFSQEIGESESVAVNCVGGSDSQSQTPTKLNNNGGDYQSGCVVSNDSFNDNGAENINNFVPQVKNGNSGHVRESSGNEEDNANGINAKHYASSIDMTKEIKEVESSCESSCEIESSDDDSDSIDQNNVSSSTSDSHGIEDFQRSVESRDARTQKTTVVTIINGAACQDGHVMIDRGGSSEPTMKDVSIQVFDENWIWASSSSETIMSGCSSNGDRGGNEEWPGSGETDPSIVQRILSSIVRLLSCCVQRTKLLN